MTKLLSCPFCDEEPSFTDVELKDERRYAEKLLRCCSIEMSATLSFGQYKGLTDAQIDHQLRSELTKSWNTRAQPQGVPEPKAWAVLYKSGSDIWKLLEDKRSADYWATQGFPVEPLLFASQVTRPK